MNIYLVALLAVYLIGMLIFWFVWGEKALVGWWVQDTITLLMWPLMVILVPIFMYLKKDSL